MELSNTSEPSTLEKLEWEGDILVDGVHLREIGLHTPSLNEVTSSAYSDSNSIFLVGVTLAIIL